MFSEETPSFYWLDFMLKWIQRKLEARRTFRFYIQTDGRDLEAIIGMVQRNQEFFDHPRPGSSCIRAARLKLEELIQQSK